MAHVKYNLVALGSAAVVAVYAAGYAKTREAAAQFADDGRDRPPIHPAKHDAVVPDVAPTEASPVPAPTKAESDKPSKPAATKKVGATPKKADTTRKGPTSAAPAASVATPPAGSPPVVAPPVVAPPATPPVASANGTPPAAPPKDTAVKAATASDTAAKSDKNVLKDGMYSGWGTSRHGDIQATVMIKDGKIVGAVISECLTQYSCSWISMLPQQVIDRQSAEVDYVSGATQSTNAFYYAVLNALKKAK